MRKRLLSILLSVCMALGLLPSVAFAGSITHGAFTVTYEGAAPTYGNNTLTLGSGTYTISGTTTADKIVVSSGAAANITLNGVSVDVSGTDDACAFDMNVATVNLTLTGTNVLKSGHQAAGLRVPTGASLTITAASTGSLDALSVSDNGKGVAGAGIGGSVNQGCGTVIINGGTVTATGGITQGGNSGAGIGGGGSNIGDGKDYVRGGTVTITGGFVTATGSTNSAGIGGGGNYYIGGAGGTVNISGGTVIATGGDWGGAGIGGGRGSKSGAGATVTITGGSVKATGGGNGAAAIGAGAGTDTSQGTLTNGNNTNIVLYTCTIADAKNTAVTNLTTTSTLGYDYGTADMKTDGEGKLYVYLPSGKTKVLATAGSYTYAGSIAGNAANLTTVYPVSGTVNTGIPGASVSGLTVNLYEYTNPAFTTSVGSATTNVSGAYTIYAPNGNYIARVAASGSYAACVSGTITVSGNAVGGANITLSRAPYTGTNASTPELTSKTDTQVVLGTVSVSGQTVEYGKNTVNAAPSEWQTTTTFTGLEPNTLYYFFARVKQAGAVEAGDVSNALDVTTKYAAPEAPSLTFDSITANSVTIAEVVDAEYSKNNGANWQDSNTFPGLSPATQYTFAIRIKETADTVAGTTASTSQYTAEATPIAGAGYSVDFATEKITVASGYEVNTDAGFGAGTAVSGDAALTAGATYYVRVAAKDGVPASEAVHFTIAARPAAPDAIAEENITKTDAVITIANTVSTQEYSLDGGGTWKTGTDGSLSFEGLPQNQTYSVVTRIPSSAASFASAFSAVLSVTTKYAAPAAPSLDFGSIAANSVTLTTVTGAEYSKDNGVTWQDSNTFPGLSPATQYTFVIRIKETADTVAGTTASQAQYTAAATPSAGMGYSVNYATERITVASGYEVSTDAGFGSGTAVLSDAPLTANKTYYVRVAAKDGVPASEAVRFEIPLRPVAPTAITTDKTKNSITITPVEGQEYKIDSGEWQGGGSFTGLAANTEYAVYARVKATNTAFASADYSISVTTKSDGSVTLPTLEAVTYSPTVTLEDITLPDKWTWSAPATVPTVAISRYSAVYTPTDTETVDYLGIEGYGTDGDDNVTITCNVPLTVNRATPTAADFAYTAPASLGYDNTAKSATVAVKYSISGMGAFTVKYYDQNDISVAAPTNAGTYTVKIDVAQGGNYEAKTDITENDWKFTIAQVEQASLSITGQPASVTYGDTFTLATTGGSGTGALTWAVTSGSSAAVDANTGAVTIKGVGETTVTATKAADGNYTAAVTDTYTFTTAKRLITVAAPSSTGGWTKIYDGKADFEKAIIEVGDITNKVDSDAISVSVESAAYDTADVGSSDKTLTITYAIDGANSDNYLAPDDTIINTASITAATPTITLKSKTEVYTNKNIEIDAATVEGVADGTAPDGVITYTYYTKDTCTDADKTSVDKSGAEAVGGAPKAVGTYYVKANIAASGNYTATTSAAVTLAIHYPSGGGTSTPVGTPVIVDGKTQNIGTEKKSGDTATVTVDQSKFGTNISAAAFGSSVVVPVTESGAATASLVVKNIADMAEKSMTLTVQTGNVAYNLNTSAIDIAALAAAFPGTDMSMVPFNVTITNSSASVADERLVLSPVEFTVTATYNGKAVSVDTFSAYIDRVIEVSAEQAAKITTAVVANADGSVRHVPTNVIEKDGKYYAVINSRTNSTYALIQNEVTFADATGKWYEAAVNEMGSRKIIAGRSADLFDGGASITRAEFAAILIRALGLPTDGTSTFSDVPADAWYTGAVATAVKYSLAKGKGDNRFDPSAAITRQEAMLMLQRAAALTEFTGTSGDLGSFADANSVGSWALDAAKWSVGSSLIQGSGGKLNPTANITRAESATIILRLLQKAELVDVRSKT